ncbi:hypothetical protein WMY93_032286 [Mugilogobius chulae]|uniref:Uncharacterized protein n=1 Tax=Mugilogobius chulae TaxID=88201 RepID=A0AAW0MLV5_9GOBI
MSPSIKADVYSGLTSPKPTHSSGTSQAGKCASLFDTKSSEELRVDALLQDPGPSSHLVQDYQHRYLGTSLPKERTDAYASHEPSAALDFQPNTPDRTPKSTGPGISEAKRSPLSTNHSSDTAPHALASLGNFALGSPCAPYAHGSFMSSTKEVPPTSHGEGSLPSSDLSAQACMLRSDLSPAANAKTDLLKAFPDKQSSGMSAVHSRAQLEGYTHHPNYSFMSHHRLWSPSTVLECNREISPAGALGERLADQRLEYLWMVGSQGMEHKHCGTPAPNRTYITSANLQPSKNNNNNNSSSSHSRERTRPVTSHSHS